MSCFALSTERMFTFTAAGKVYRAEFLVQLIHQSINVALSCMINFLDFPENIGHEIS